MHLMFISTVVSAINGLLRVVKELEWSLEDIFDNFGEFWRKITSDSQMRWVIIFNVDL